MDPRHSDILIIGAGLAGLSAAVELSKIDRTVRVLEARDRIGGRVLTRHSRELDAPIELGAEWFDSKGELRELLEGTGHRMEMARGSFLQRTEQGLKSDDQEDPFRGLLKELGKLEGPDRSLTQALDELPKDGNTEAGAALLDYVRGFHAADPQHLSVHWLLEVEKNQSAEASQLRAIEGAGAGVEHLRSRLSDRCHVHLSCAVNAVSWAQGRVEMSALENGSLVHYTASKAIVTLPLAVLPLVRFDPPLSTKHEAMAHLATGNVVKVVLTFRTNFWKDDPDLRKALFVLDQRQPVPTWWNARPTEAAIWNGWAGGPMAEPLLGSHGDDLRMIAVRSLAGTLGRTENELTDQLTGCYSHDWAHDPFARGAYTYVRPGGLHAHRSLAAPLERTLYFAGEATCGEGYNATMEGAARSGRRAVRELLIEDGRGPVP